MNPNETTAAPIDTASATRIRRTRRGPALYIVGCGFLGGFVAVPSLMARNAIGLLAITFGCIAGGLAFRLTTENGQHDATVRWRQIVYSLVAVVLPTLLCWFATDEYGPRIPYTVIAFSVGASVAIGIFVSGTRRI